MEFIFTIICLVLCVVLILGGGLAAFAIGLYNGLVKLRTLVEEAWSGIDVQLKKRYDLIPNLVETVKAYAKHESKVFEQVAELRSSAMNAEGAAEKAQYEGELTSTLKSLFAVAESYPELKANENFLGLQNDLQEIEDQIEKARRYYNGTVREYNIKIDTFPNNLIAGTFGFTKREFFEVDNEDERKNVKVDFSGIDKSDESSAKSAVKVSEKESQKEDRVE